MELSNKFSLVDFLAYLFPGGLTAIGLVLLLLLTPVFNNLPNFQVDWLAAGILLIIISYSIGVIFSGFAEILEYRIAIKRYPRIKATIPFPELKNDIIQAMNELLGKPKENNLEWTVSHYYLCRSFIWKYVPEAKEILVRETSIRQLRLNLLHTVTVWALAGIGWGIKLINDQILGWGIILLVGSMLAWYPLCQTLINRMRSNEAREVREVLSAFLVTFKAKKIMDTNKEKIEKVN